VTGILFFNARLPAAASMGMMIRNRPTNIAMPRSGCTTPCLRLDRRTHCRLFAAPLV